MVQREKQETQFPAYKDVITLTPRVKKKYTLLYEIFTTYWFELKVLAPQKRNHMQIKLWN